MTDTELTKMLRSSANRVVTYAADRIEALTAERDGLLRCVTDNHVALCRADKAEAERDRLREALRDGRRLWAIAQADRIRLLIQLEQCEKRHD